VDPFGGDSTPFYISMTTTTQPDDTTRTNPPAHNSSTGEWTIAQNVSLFGPNAAVGEYPAEIIQSKDGTFWLSTYSAGKSTSGHFADGTVFSVNLGLPPL
jgi:hypothetical protein